MVHSLSSLDFISSSLSHEIYHLSYKMILSTMPQLLICFLRTTSLCKILALGYILHVVLSFITSSVLSSFSWLSSFQLAIVDTLLTGLQYIFICSQPNLSFYPSRLFAWMHTPFMALSLIDCTH